MSTVAERVVRQLKALGVRYVFGIPGGPWVPFMEAMREEGIQFILVANEASAGFMADVTSRLTGVPGICHGTFGPGATNLATGVGCGLLDRSAVIAMTSEVPDAMMQRTTQMRIDQQALFEPITKQTLRLNPVHPAQTLFKAMELSVSGIPGPVHIGVPSDIGDVPCVDEIVTTSLIPAKPGAASAESIAEVSRALSESKRPLLAVGLTAAREGLVVEVTALADATGGAVVLTPMAKGIINEDHPSYQGVLFHALSTELVDVIAKADLVVGVGYDPVEFNYESWMPEATPLVSLDVCSADIDKNAYTLKAEAVGDLKTSLGTLIDKANKSAWTSDELAQSQQRIHRIFNSKLESFGPVSAFTAIRKMMPEDGILTLDVGAHLHLAGQLWRTPGLNHVLMTDGWSSMGFAMPAAIAAKLNCPEKAVVCVTGDGGFLMMAGEIVTARRLELNVVFVVLADRELSLIAVKQDWKEVPRYGTDLYVGEYFQAETFMGAPVYRAASTEQMENCIEKALQQDGPVVVEAVVDGTEYKELISRKYK